VVCMVKQKVEACKVEAWRVAYREAWMAVWLDTWMAVASRVEAQMGEGLMVVAEGNAGPGQGLQVDSEAVVARGDTERVAECKVGG